MFLGKSGQNCTKTKLYKVTKLHERTKLNEDTLVQEKFARNEV